MGATTGIPDDLDEYNEYIKRMRQIEYPMLKDAIYLDHAATTLYSKTLLERFHSNMMANLYGNPHSASRSSQHSTQEIETVRLEMLQFLNADPDHFDLVFTANATAGIKLVGDAFRDHEEGFCFGYHVDSHTSLVGLREYAKTHKCFESVDELKTWIMDLDGSGRFEQQALFAYPLQSNMNGRRLPLTACQDVIQSNCLRKIYTLVDAAAYASTSPLDLSDVHEAPDFTVLSLYKIFGFPDLGALIVKKDVAHVFQKRRYFGGGTVDMVVCLKEQWHAKKSGALHMQLEDGTLPIHSIMALRSAIQTHNDLFGSLDRISKHTANLAKQLHERLSSLKHGNNQPACTIYKHCNSHYGDVKTQGPVVSFNLHDSKGKWVSNAEMEKLASIKNIHLRTGGVCNPGGVAMALNLEPWEMRENFSAGHSCGGENDILNGKPTGVIRVSIGAVSTRADIERFLQFVEEFFVDNAAEPPEPHSPLVDIASQRFRIESLTIYPIKSCGSWRIPEGQSWEVRTEGLAWDREWCVIHQGTGKALSQKQYPRMALLRPRLDFKTGQLYVNAIGIADTISIPLSRNPSLYASSVRETNASVCEDPIEALVYVSPTIADFFTKAIGVVSTLARFNPASGVSRHSKAHLQSPNNASQFSKVATPILLSNDSPMLTISRSSLNRLNEQIKAKGGKAATPSVFRPNIVIAESSLLAPSQEQPWAEDYWQSMRVGGADGPLLEFLGGCRRCQMVCVDQETAEKNAEPFVTLAKTRRRNGRVLFGVHTALVDALRGGSSIKAGDMVELFSREDEMKV